MWTKGSSCITIELRDLLSHWRLVGLPDCPIMAISNLITPHTHSLQWSENPRVTREAMIEWKWNNDWVKVAILFYPSFKDKANVRHKMRRFLKIWEWREEKSRGEVLPPFNQKKKKIQLKVVDQLQCAGQGEHPACASERDRPCKPVNQTERAVNRPEELQ